MEIGYVFYPPPHPGALGHPQLDIHLFETPTGLHFDPCEASFPIYDPKVGIDELYISHPTMASHYRVCAGRVVIRNHLDKRVEAFSFGGDLAVENCETYTLCRLTSSAPIFDVDRFHEDEAELVSSIESDLARMHAQWLENDAGFEQSLAMAEPEKLFLALMAYLEKRQRKIPPIYHDERYWNLMQSIHNAIRFVSPEGNLPLDLPTLDDLI